MDSVSQALVEIELIRTFENKNKRKRQAFS